MTSATINGKEYKFMFNANTPELYYQVFGEDLTLIMYETQKDNMTMLRGQRCPKLAYIANMQATHSFKELANRLTRETYMEWLEQFDSAATFMLNTEVLTAVIGGWNDSCVSSVEIKNQESPQ